MAVASELKRLEEVRKLTIKGCKTIAEYAIRRYLIDQGFQLAFLTWTCARTKGRSRTAMETL